MTRTERRVAIEAYAQALLATGPRASSPSQEARWLDDYREIAERKVAELERVGALDTIARVA